MALQTPDDRELARLLAELARIGGPQISQVGSDFVIQQGRNKVRYTTGQAVRQGGTIARSR